MFDAESQVIPAGLDEMEIGPLLAVILLSVDVNKLSGHDRIVVLRAHQRLTSHFNARMYEGMASVIDVMEDVDPRAAAESAAAEIRAALRLTRTASDTELAFALDLLQRLPGCGKRLSLARLMSNGPRPLSGAPNTSPSPPPKRWWIGSSTQHPVSPPVS